MRDTTTVNHGYALIALSLISLILGTHAMLSSTFFPLSGVPILDVLARDTHYKYFIVFIMPMGFYFVIANWVGWQYYRNS